MKETIRLAVKNVREESGGPFASIIVKQGRVLATGVNKVTSEMDPTAHAEIVAIRNACRELNSFQITGCDLYTSCEPCPMCLGAIYWARPDRVYYASSRVDAANAGFDDKVIYDEISLVPNERKIPMEQLLQDEADLVFQEWMDNPDRIRY